MTSVTILQSAADLRPEWVSRCMRSVANWSQRQGYAYLCIGDEIFDWVTPGLRKKLGERTPILADLARLRWIESELATRKGLVVWIDADTLVVDPTWRIPDSVHTFFGEECWVQEMAEGTWRAYQSPHNAFMGFTATSPVLGFLVYLSESIIERADAAHIAPQMVGPKLLKALNNLAQFSLVPEAGAVSPELLAEWVSESGKATRCYEQAHRPPLALVNLCSSLNDSDEALQRVEQFLTYHGA
ncbi:MAG: hypothetical protein CME45_03910 [Halieaceae bacterium]|nr:hypothetical protein [Halieaceae bacterium]MAI94142.1 hypothetical protein [Halieaceae bacterium]